jgi:hypothetical protein
MQISIKKTADVDVGQSIIQKLQETIGGEKAGYPMTEVLDLLNEAADLLEPLEEHSKCYDKIIGVIKFIGDKTSDKKVIEVGDSKEVEEEVQEEIEEQKKE